ncbi:MAG: hypothetical protein ABIG39_04785 [Candidatus Micrarchaeota archaeon]
MKRGPRIGTIKPRLGFTFKTYAAPYPPPSAHSAPDELLSELRTVDSLRESAVQLEDNEKILYFARIFVSLSEDLDGAFFPKKAVAEVYTFKKKSKRFRESIDVLTTRGPSGLSDPAYVKGPIRIPEPLSAFRSGLVSLNTEFRELMDGKARKSIKLSMELLFSHINTLLSKEALGIKEHSHPGQYKASLKLTDKYERILNSLLRYGRSGDVQGMVSLAGGLGIDLRKLLYQKGVYMGEAPKRRTKAERLREIFKKSGRRVPPKQGLQSVKRDDIKKMLEYATRRKNPQGLKSESGPK